MTDRCPSDAQLLSYLNGRNPNAFARMIERHVQECSHCPARLAVLRVDSRLTRALSDSGTGSRVISRGLNELMNQLVDMVPGSRTHVGDEAGKDTEVEEGFPFLEHSDNPNDLGRLGDYRVIRLIGRGGMGIVFRAIDEQLGREVGLKVLRPKSNRDPLARTRFLQEARAMAALRHDHIAMIYQVGEVHSPIAGEPGIAFLTMELLNGTSLQSWMAAHPRPPIPLVLRIAQQATFGLATAHAHNLIHRDIKPSNLWLESPSGWEETDSHERPPLGEAGRVKVIDFGLATPIGDEGLTASIVGTPIYMAPEQFAGSPPDPRSDLFSLGCVLYELCTGEHPFPARRHGRPYAPDPTPTPARELNPAVPKSLSQLLDRLLSPEPGERPQSARELLVNLQAIATESGRHQPTRRTTLTGALLVLLVVVGAAGAGIGYWNSTESPLSTASVPLSATPTNELTPPLSVERQPVADPNRPPFPAGPPDDWWIHQLADRSPQDQFRIVSAKLAELNPGYDANTASGWVEPELVIRYTVQSNAVSDIRPIRGLLDVKTLTIEGLKPGAGQLVNLAPLKGLRLFNVNFRNNPRLRDITALQGMDLSRATFTHTAVDSLKALQGMKLTELNIEGCPIHDLTPIQTMTELRVLRCTGCPIRSYQVLAGSKIQHLWADLDPEVHLDLLRAMPHLQQLNGQGVLKD